MRRSRISNQDVKDKGIKVRIHTVSGSIFSGYVYCPYRRLVDVLNNVSSSREISNSGFLRVTKAEMLFLYGKCVADSAYINKADILFVRPMDSESVPYTPKPYTPVRLHMPSYNVTGHIHYTRGRRLEDVLNSVFSFFAMTNVEIRSVECGDVLKASFVAVNKERILALEELGDSVKGMYL